MQAKRIMFFGSAALVLTATASSLIWSCKHEARGLDQFEKVCFESQILPIFQTSCSLSGCHDAPGGESDYVFSTYEGIMEAISPGNPLQSEAYKSIISSGENAMPPNQPLSRLNRTLIRIWIEQGALNESCAIACDTSGIMNFDENVWPIINRSCVSCHSGENPQGGLLLDDYCKVAVQSNNGKLAKVLRGSGLPLMPPSGALPLCEIRQIELWIEGDSDTLCSLIPDTTEYYNPFACFNRDILPVLKSGCGISGCHDAITQRDGYNFTTYAGTMEAVKAGNPLSSDLYEVISTDEADDRMPPAPYSPLPQAAIDSVYKWISYGAKDEDCGESCDTVSTITFSGVVWPVILANCRGCHSGTSPSGGVSLTNYSQVAIQAGNNKLTGVLRGTGYSIMPPSGPLSDCKIRQIELWVQAGYQNNK